MRVIDVQRAICIRLARRENNRDDVPQLYKHISWTGWARPIGHKRLEQLSKIPATLRDKNRKRVQCLRTVEIVGCNSKYSEIMAVSFNGLIHNRNATTVLHKHPEKADQIAENLFHRHRIGLQHSRNRIRPPITTRQNARTFIREPCHNRSLKAPPQQRERK